MILLIQSQLICMQFKIVARTLTGSVYVCPVSPVLGLSGNSNSISIYTISLIICYIIDTASFTPAKGRTPHPSFVALAVTSTCFLTPTMEKKGTRLTGISQCCTERQPLVCFHIKLPAPPAEVRDLLVTRDSLSPNKTCLKD